MNPRTDRFPEEDLVPSPGGWDVPDGVRAGWDWVPPGGARPTPEVMTRGIRLLYRTPLLDRYAHEVMWFGGGFLVLPPDHWWFEGMDQRPTGA
ncbi:MAG: hypothetical protein AAGF73_04495 [Actinomycetota bacterium]